MMHPSTTTVCRWLLLLHFVIEGGGGMNLDGGGGGSGPCEHSNLTQILHDLVLQHSSIASISSIGNSSQGRPLWVMVLGERVDLRPRLRPMVKLVGNLNGYSGPACYTLLSLAKRLLTGYRRVGSSERSLLSSLELHILFDMNPDAFAKARPGSCTDGLGRVNSFVNLNRDFPQVFPSEEEEDETQADPATLTSQHQRQHQPETEAVIHWSLENNFLLSLSLLAGHSLVVVPFDDELGVGVTGQPHPTPDDDIFQALASKYASFLWGGGGGGSTAAPWNCPTLGRKFDQGWVNGAEWYPARGTMMDWSYVRAGTPELTLGLGCCRNPLPDDPDLIHSSERHGEAIFSLLVDVTRGGVRGQVVDSFSGEVLDGVMLSRVGLFSLPWFTSSQGEFWRLLPQGRHSLEVNREGYRKTRVEIDVGGFEMEEDTPTTITIHLRPLHPPTTTTTTPKSVSNFPPSPTPTPTSSSTTTPTTTQEPDVDLTSATPSKNIVNENGTGKWIEGFHRGLGVMLAYSSSATVTNPQPHPSLLLVPPFLKLILVHFSTRV